MVRDMEHMQWLTTVLLVSLVMATLRCGKLERERANACEEPTPGLGFQVFYTGPKGSQTRFPDEKLSYTGKINAAFGSDQFEIDWQQLDYNTVTERTILKVESQCDGDKLGKRVLYAKFPAVQRENFPDQSRDYVGKVVLVFQDGLFEVDWDHLNFNTVETQAQLMIAQ